MRPLWVAAITASSMAAPAPAQVFSPIPVTGYTKDVIADAGGLPPTWGTTSGFDLTSNPSFGYVLYQQGFNTSFPARGVPAGGSIVSSPTRSYQLGPIAGNNSLQLEGPTNVTGTLALTTPARYAALSLLLADGAGRQPSQGGSQGTLAVNWSNGNTTAYPYTSYDWFLLSGTPGPNSGVAIGGLDRFWRANGTFDNSTTDPRPYYYDFDLSADANYLAGALINGVTATQVQQGPVTNIMGLSGAVTVPEPSTLALLAAAGGLSAFRRGRPGKTAFRG